MEEHATQDHSLLYSRDRRTAVYHGVLRAVVRTSNIHESIIQSHNQ